MRTLPILIITLVIHTTTAHGADPVAEAKVALAMAMAQPVSQVPTTATSPEAMILQRLNENAVRIEENEAILKANADRLDANSERIKKNTALLEANAGRIVEATRKLESMIDRQSIRSAPAAQESCPCGPGCTCPDGVCPNCPAPPIQRDPTAITTSTPHQVQTPGGEVFDVPLSPGEKITQITNDRCVICRQGGGCRLVMLRSMRAAPPVVAPAPVVAPVIQWQRQDCPDGRCRIVPIPRR